MSMPRRTQEHAKIKRGVGGVFLGDENLCLGEPEGLLCEIKPPYLRTLALSCCLHHT